MTLPDTVPINKLFSLRMPQIAKLSDISQRTGKDNSEIVREAIDEYFENHKDEETQVQPAAQEV